MIGDILEAIFEDLPVGRGEVSKRTQIVLRLFFGLLGTALGIMGIVKFAADPALTRNIALRLSMTGLFTFLACFCLFNIAFVRKWRWPGRLFMLSLVMAFVTRILLGS